ncbi:15-hydroxyprostaglandin dehydrogenase [NAD(+)]-like [Photinus pyralis]|nr:15-hydroxyprostaglandin dehydrogenase [NAD(+)]-like [Photinus pyralis]
MFNLNQKVAIVTGGAQGIGLAIVKELLRNGAKGVSIIDINATAAKRAVSEIQDEFGLGKVLFITADVSIESQFEDAFEQTISTFENLDIVVNNAGISCNKDWTKGISVNLTGTVNGTMLGFERYLPENKSDNEAIILNVASISALSFIPAGPVYSATKGGVVALTRAMGQDVHYVRKRVKVMAVCPGFTDTALGNVNKEALYSDDYMAIYEYYFRNNVTIFQTTDEVARAAIKILKEGENGSVWVAANKEPPFEIERLTLEQLKKVK